MAKRIAWLESNSRRVLAGFLGVTVLLFLPLLLLEPDTQASSDPEGPVFEARDLIEDRLVSPLFTPFYLVEARGGDMLLQQPLLELLQREEAVRSDPDVAPKLYAYESASYGATVTGVYTIADAVDRHLKANGVDGGLAEASDEHVKLAISELLRPELGTADLGDGFSKAGSVERREIAGREIDYWVSPAIGFAVLADNEALGGGGFTAALGGDERIRDKEQYSRDIQSLLRDGAESYDLWGVAIDANLTSEEEGATAGPFITFTIIAVLGVTGLVLRSYWAVAIIGLALASLIVWLKGITNLINLEGSLVMSFIVPIAMISFGIDFAFHAVGRYREERRSADRPATAYVIGLTAVLPALFLAFATDSLAFLSNLTSGIPAIIQFGLGATVALLSAFIVLGILAPLALMRVEEGVQTDRPSGWFAQVRRFGVMGLASLAAGSTVLMLIFFPVAGVVAWVVYLVVFLALPLAYARRQARDTEAPAPSGAGGASWEAIGFLVRRFGQSYGLILPVAALITAASAWLAVKVEASFDVKDFFSSGSDFVISLDKLDEHSAGGEPAIIYIEGDLRRPDSLAAMKRFVERLDAIESDRFGRLAGGKLQIDKGALGIVKDAVGSDFAVAAIESATGVQILDADGDLIPEDPEAIAAIYAYASEGGVPGEAGMIVTPQQVPEALWNEPEGRFQATRIVAGIQGTREQANIDEARELLTPLVADLEQELQTVLPRARVQLTGSPIERDEGLDATVRSLMVSLPVAVVLCLTVAALFMRSVRFGVLAAVPILLVVAWLYALMFLLDFQLNVVTATIGAISIGVGIDYAIHFTIRFREELARSGNRSEALESTGTGTGSALVASALSSVIGFSIMAFAPMPMFATYGLLTAAMILFAASASLVVLPALLYSVTRDATTGRPSPELVTVAPDAGR